MAALFCTAESGASEGHSTQREDVVAVLGQTERGCFPVAGSKPAASRTEAVEEFTEAAREKVSDMGTDNHFDFSEALKALLQGKRVRRLGWINRDDYSLQLLSEVLRPNGPRRRIYVHIRNDSPLLWPVCQDDILAADWVLVEEEPAISSTKTRLSDEKADKDEA